MSIAENIALLRENVEKCCQNAGKKPSDVQIMAVTKTVDADRINEAVAAGLSVLGENRVQELLSKAENVDKSARWHIIGQMQTNKVKYIVDKIELLHSVDRVELLKEIDRRSAQVGTKLSVLLEVNISEEISKAGVKPQDVDRLIEAASEYENLNVRGFMTIAPTGTDNDTARPYFERVFNIFERYAGKTEKNINVSILSMGMTADYQAAILEGANMIRVGSAIFGTRS